MGTNPEMVLPLESNCVKTATGNVRDVRWCFVAATSFNADERLLANAMTSEAAAWIHHAVQASPR